MAYYSIYQKIKSTVYDFTLDYLTEHNILWYTALSFQGIGRVIEAKEVTKKRKNKMKNTKVDYRSAKTGRFVKENYATTHKSTTVKETRRK